jgi:hypothetical protein
MKFRLVGAELFREDRQTDWTGVNDKYNSRLFLDNFLKAPNMGKKPLHILGVIIVGQKLK